uniref:MULE transposase domain-containing protein n=1 Tax=Lactuca sativa TaxID=4236 RepID=A0A9R1XKM6_LACSA|nr:hypothetical protein LSAT_V11C300145570 [Lactuca sativa]
MITVMDDLDMHILHYEEIQPETQVMDDLDMNDIGNNHYYEENHQFSSGDLEILHNDEKQSETQVYSDNVVAQYDSCKQFIGADGSFFWIPKFEASWIPPMGSFFKDIKDAIKKSTERKKMESQLRNILGGLPNTSTLDTISDDLNKQLRISNCKRTNCKAFFSFKVITDFSEVYQWHFEQQHNHKLINQDCMNLSRAKRQLDVVDQAFIHKLSRTKMGETTSYRLMGIKKGGCEFVSGLEIDWKIFTRDINYHIGVTDANLLTTKHKNHKKNKYRCDKKQLNALFWADDTSKQNFEYCMVFVPFTTIDNHKGASHLELSFLKCFGKAPIMVMTDQDSTMKKAIEIVLPQTTHIFCMCHIASKAHIWIAPITSSP